jgi:hypothetical protein
MKPQNYLLYPAVGAAFNSLRDIDKKTGKTRRPVYFL